MPRVGGLRRLAHAHPSALAHVLDRRLRLDAPSPDFHARSPARRPPWPRLIRAALRRSAAAHLPRAWASLASQRACPRSSQHLTNTNHDSVDDPRLDRPFVEGSHHSRPDNDAPNQPSESNHAVIDRLPPQSLEAEQSVLGAILIDRDAIIEVAEFLRAEDFYRQANGRIYAAILDLFERREPIDIVTVAETLERREELEADRRACLSLEPLQRDAHRRPRRPVRADRRAQGGAAKPDRCRRPDRRHRLRGPGRDRRGHRPRRGRALRRQPEAGRRRVQRRSRRCSTTPTTASTTCTPTAARSAASAPASRTSMR